MAETKVAIRLGTDGKAEVQRDFAEVGRAGKQAMEDISAASVATGTAGERAAQRQIDAWKRQAAAAKVAATEQSANSGFNQLLGVRAVDTGAAARSAAIFQETEALGKLNAGLGFNRTQFVVGTAAARNFVDSILAGQSPLSAFTMQAGDLATVLQSDDQGVSGGLKRIGSLFSPTVLGLAGVTAALVIGAAAWASYAGATAKLEQISIGSGRVIGATKDALEANAEAAARAGSTSVSAARDIQTAYVQLGGVGLDVLPKLTAETENFAAATGTDTAAAVQTLGEAFKDPIKGAEQLTRQYGLFTQEQIIRIRQLVEENRISEAQIVLLDGLNTGMDGAIEKASALSRAWAGVSGAVSNGFTRIGAAIDNLADGLDVDEQIERLTRIRALAVQGSANPNYIADVDGQIAALKRLQTSETDTAAARTKSAQANQAAQAKAEAQAKLNEEAQKDRDREAKRRAADRVREAKQIADALERERAAQLKAITESPGTASRALPGSIGSALSGIEAQTAASARALESLQALINPADRSLSQIVTDIDIAKAKLIEMNKIPPLNPDALRLGESLLQSAASSITDAITGAQSLGDALVNTFARAAAAILESGILNILSGGKQGFSFGDAISGITSIFGGGPARNAIGTPYFSGGATYLAENGPELVTLPTGSRVDNASATRRKLSGSGEAGAPPRMFFDLRGAVLTSDLLAQMNSLANGAAQRGANGGAQIAAAQRARTARRSL
jgi:hypothetical protein